MSIDKNIVLTIVASFFVCGHTNADPFTVHEYQGVWYHVATIYPTNSKPPFTCVWSNIIKKPDSDTEFDESFSFMNSGEVLKSTGYGKVVDSEVQFSHPSIGLSMSAYTVTKYNDGNELILHNKDSVVHSSLVSRATTASEEAKKAFEEKAMNASAEVTYIEQDGCSY